MNSIPNNSLFRIRFKLAEFEMRKQFLDEKSHRRVLFVRNYDFFALKSV